MKSKAEVARSWEQVRAHIEQASQWESIAALVDAAASQFGEQVAWSFFERGEVLSFLEVQALSLRAAGLFGEMGVARGDTVAMMAENSPAYLGGWLGLMRIGAAMVPVNTRYLPRELRHVLETSRAGFLVIDHDLLPIFQEIAQDFPHLSPDRILVVDGQGSGMRDWHGALMAATPVAPGTDEGRADDIANVQYTSGTTGFPKGCLLPQRYWLNVALTWGEYLEFPVRNVICNQRLFYIDGLFLAMMCLYKGAAYHICSKPSANKFGQWLVDYEIDYCFYFDPLFKVEPKPEEAGNKLKLISIFGFNRKNHAALEQRYGAIARESFGMSEYAPSLIMPLDADVMVGSGSCGLVAPFTQAKLVDEKGREVSRGAEGELWVRSDAMMIGYVGDAAATAETLQDGWLKTGDLFVQDEDGFFYIVGRKKDMVRKNSENIACREVEDVVRLLPEVLEVAMVPVPDDVVGEEAKLYIQLRQGVTQEDMNPVRLIDYCSINLATFKVPRYIAYVDSFPMTDSARVAKKVLVAGIPDLRMGSYDRVDQLWRP